MELGSIMSKGISETLLGIHRSRHYEAVSSKWWERTHHVFKYLLDRF